MSKKLVVVILGIFIAATVAAVGDADAVVICAKKKNAKKVRLRAGDTCKKNETAIPIDADTVRGLVPQQIGLSTGGGLVVRDANGALVGTVIGVTFDETLAYGVGVARLHGGIWLTFNVDGSGFQPETESSLRFAVLYADASCSGTQLVLADSLNPLMRRLYVQGNVGYYAADPIQQIRGYRVSLLSRDLCERIRGNPVEGGCCEERPSGPFGPLFGGQATTIDLSTLGLLPPFRIEGLQ